jgi:hypothetical protein
MGRMNRPMTVEERTSRLAAVIGRLVPPVARWQQVMCFLRPKQGRSNVQAFVHHAPQCRHFDAIWQGSV